MTNGLYGKGKRGLSLILAIFMLLGSLGLTVFADEETAEPAEPTELITEPVSTEPETTEDVTLEKNASSSEGAGYYLVGSMNGWQPTNGYKFSENNGASGEYKLDVTLSSGNEFKVVYSGNGSSNDTWFPDGDNYKVTSSGRATVYFRPDYQGASDWYSGCIYVSMQPSYRLENGYYLIGLNGWTADSLTASDKLTKNESAGTEEYTIQKTLSYNNAFKIAYVENDAIKTWYPSDGDNYVVGEQYTGSKTIYFRPNYDGSESWHYGCIYVPRTQRLENGYYIMGLNISGDWTVDKLTASDKMDKNDGADTEEYFIRKALNYNDNFKVVKVENDTIQDYYPAGGQETNYVVGWNYTGSDKTIYFRPNRDGSDSWHYGYIYIEKTTSLENGFYLINFNTGDTVDTINSAWKFSQNTGASDNEYLLNVTLSGNEKLKVVKVENDQITAYYPPEGNDYQPDQYHTGDVTVYFRESYQDAWADPFGGYFYIAQRGDGSHGDFYIIGRSGWTVNDLTEADKLYINIYYGQNYPGVDHEYMRLVNLYQGQEIKIVEVKNGQIVQWYGVNHAIDYDSQHNVPYYGNQFVFFMETLTNDRGVPYTDNDGVSHDDDWQWGRGLRFSVQKGWATIGAEGTSRTNYTDGTLTKTKDGVTQEYAQGAYPTYGYDLEHGQITFSTGTAYDNNDFANRNAPTPNILYNLNLGQEIGYSVTPDEGWRVVRISLSYEYEDGSHEGEYELWSGSSESAVGGTFTAKGAAMRLIAEFEKIPVLHNVTVVGTEFGVIGVSSPVAINAGQTQQVTEGETVVINARAYGGCELIDIPVATYTDNGQTVSIPLTLGTDYSDKAKSGSFTFVMPEHDVTISVESRRIIRSCNLLLSGEIGLNIYADLQYVGGSVDDTYMTFRVTQSREGTAETRDDYDPEHTITFRGLDLYGYTCFVNAIQMACPVKTTLHYKDAEGNEREVYYTYSVDSYLKSVAGDSTEEFEDAQKMIKAIADFGYYTQQYLSRINSFTIGTDYAAMNTHFAEYTSSDWAEVQAALENQGVSTKCKTTDVTKVEHYLSLNAKTTIVVKITVNDGYALKSAHLDSSTEDFAFTKTGNVYTFMIEGIPAGSLATRHKIKAVSFQPGVEGEENDVEITLSALSYAKTILDSSTEQADAKNAMTALYHYYYETKAYAMSHTVNN